jgi:DNA recombination protein RmuC
MDMAVVVIGGLVLAVVAVALGAVGARAVGELRAQAAEGQAALDAKKESVDVRLEGVERELRTELVRLGQLVQRLGEASGERFGQVDQALRAHTQAATALADSTRTLREALANPGTRGQWGERMAEDVLRLAGFVEHINYTRHQAVDGGGLPDFTFPLPKGHVLFMDVKFPMAAYLRYLEADSETERAAHLRAFLRDVRMRVKELSARDYAGSTGSTVDYVLMFLPNESLSAFVHQHDPRLIDDAMAQRVVLCSPLTLFALLGVVRQAYDAFMVEETTDEVLSLLGRFGQQWVKFAESLDKVRSRFDSVHRELEQLGGPRRRQLERSLVAIDELRRERGAGLGAEVVNLVAVLPDDADELEASAGGR